MSDLNTNLRRSSRISSATSSGEGGGASLRPYSRRYQPSRTTMDAQDQVVSEGATVAATGNVSTNPVEGALGAPIGSTAANPVEGIQSLSDPPNGSTSATAPVLEHVGASRQPPRMQLRTDLDYVGPNRGDGHLTDLEEEWPEELDIPSRAIVTTNQNTDHLGLRRQ